MVFFYIIMYSKQFFFSFFNKLILFSFSFFNLYSFSSSSRFIFSFRTLYLNVHISFTRSRCFVICICILLKKKLKTIIVVSKLIRGKQIKCLKKWMNLFDLMLLKTILSLSFEPSYPFYLVCKNIFQSVATSFYRFHLHNFCVSFGTRQCRCRNKPFCFVELLK